MTFDRRVALTMAGAGAERGQRTSMAGVESSHSSRRWPAHPPAATINRARDIESVNSNIQLGNNYNSTIHNEVHHHHDGSSQREDILRKLTDLPYKDRKDFNPPRIPGTCEWFLRHPLYQEWRYCPTLSSLWVSADPGCGKSVLAKHLVDYELSSGTTCFFFFKDGVHDQCNMRGALRCILYQLLSQRTDLFSDDIVRRFSTQGFIWESLVELWDVLVQISRKPAAGEIVCVFDAYDECNGDEREEFFRAVQGFYSNHRQRANERSRLKLLITSRPIQQIHAQLNHISTIRLAGETESNVDQIAQEIALVIKHKARLLETEQDVGRRERGNLQEKLLAQSNRTYLWVDLVFKYIRVLLTKGHRDVFSQSSDTSVLMPETIDEAYDKILQQSTDAEKAKELLQIILAATRPLTVNELALALQIKENTKPRDELTIWPQEVFINHLRNLCGLFIVIIDSRAHLLHQTAREFLLDGGFRPEPATAPLTSLVWKNSISLVDANRLLATRCIQYLLLENVEEKPVTCDESDVALTLTSWQTDPALRVFAFIDYAACHWHLHVRNSNFDDFDSVIRLCTTNTPGEYRGLYPYWFELSWLKRDMLVHDITPLIIASYCGVPVEVINKLLGSRWRLKTWQYITKSEWHSRRDALSWAAEHGYLDTVKCILSHIPRPIQAIRRNLFIDSQDEVGRTPLAFAALNGHYDVVDLLLRRSAQPDIEDGFGGTPLFYAFCSGNKRVVDRFLKGRTINPQRQKEIDDGLLKLLVNSIIGTEYQVVRRVIETGLVAVQLRVPEAALEHTISDLDQWPKADDEAAHSPRPSSLLSLVAYRGDTQMLELLLDRGAEVEPSTPEDGMTPLHWAARNYLPGVVELVCDAGADVNRPTPNGLRPLDMCIHPQAMRSLLDRGADFRCTKGMDDEARARCRNMILNFRPPADEKRPLWLTFALIQQNGLSQRYVLALLAIASASNSREVLRDFLQMGVDANEVTNTDQTFFHLATWHAVEAASLELLLDHGADLEARDVDGRTPLYSACDLGSPGSVRLLLAKGANVNAEDNYGYTPLAVAAATAQKCDVALRWLVEHGADLEARNIYGQTPLHLATRWGSPNSVRLLLAKGANVNAKDSDGYTPLDVAVEGLAGYETMRPLVEYGADVASVSWDTFLKTVRGKLYTAQVLVQKAYAS